MAVAKPKISELSEEFSQVLENFSESLILDQFAVKRLERKVSDLFLIPEFEFEARLLYAHLCSIQRNQDLALHHVQRASQIVAPTRESKEYINKEIAAVSMESFDVIAAYNILSRFSVAESVSLNRWFPLAMQSGMFIKACEILDRFEMSGAEFTEGQVGAAKTARVASDFLIKNNLSDSDVVDRLAVAAKVVARRFPTFPNFVYGCVATPDAGILYRFPVPADIETIVQLDWDIAEALVDSFDDPLGEVISFVASPSGGKVVALR